MDQGRMCVRNGIFEFQTHPSCRSLDSLRAALHVKSNGRTQAKKASNARAVAASAQQAKVALNNTPPSQGVAASFIPVLRGTKAVGMDLAL